MKYSSLVTKALVVPRFLSQILLVGLLALSSCQQDDAKNQLKIPGTEAAALGALNPATAGPDSIRWDLLADRSQYSPGQPVKVALRARITKGWHLYWRYPGNTGLPVKISQQSNKYTLSEFRYPIPEYFTPDFGPGTTTTQKMLTALPNIGYSEKAIFLADLYAPESSGDISLDLTVSWLACESVVGRCVPGKQVLNLELSPQPSAQTEESEVNAELFETAEELIPVDLNQLDYTHPDQPVFTLVESSVQDLKYRYQFEWNYLPDSLEVFPLLAPGTKLKFFKTKTDQNYLTVEYQVSDERPSKLLGLTTKARAANRDYYAHLILK